MADDRTVGFSGFAPTDDTCGFSRLTAPAYQPGSTAPARLGEIALPGWRDAKVRVLRPFSWDAAERGFELNDVPLGSRPRHLVSGPYAVADAAALELGADTDFTFPVDPEDGGHYLGNGTIPVASSSYQDSAGWFTIAGYDPNGQPVAVASVLDFSGTVVTSIVEDERGVVVGYALPWQTFSPTTSHPLPTVLVRIGAGDHSDAEQWLRDLFTATIPRRESASGLIGGPHSPPLMADTWGFGEEIDPERVAGFMDVAAGLGVEVVTIDKGWEAQVGDWWARPDYTGGIPALVTAAHARGMAFGAWCAPGNASPASTVAREHPDWLATWRGRPMTLSFDNHLLCLGHRPARDHVLRQLLTLGQQGLDWMVHDFETIARCDSAGHTHDPGGGEAAAEAGWYEVLGALREHYPGLAIENCWNGGRPLDLRMIAHHDTTIGDDWCRSEYNRVAKLGLGRYLPSSWCTAYMSDEDLPLTSQLAPHVVGGPWIFMGDLASWDDLTRATVRTAVEIYKRWRTADLTARVVAPATSSPVAGVATTPRADGSVLAAFVIREPDLGRDIRWFPGLAGTGAVTLRDEWTGACTVLDAAALGAGVALDTAREGGLVLSVSVG